MDSYVPNWAGAGQFEYSGGYWPKATIFLNSFAHVSWTAADYFLGVRRYFFEINDSTGKVFNLEVNDLIGL